MWMTRECCGSLFIISQYFMISPHLFFFPRVLVCIHRSVSIQLYAALILVNPLDDSLVSFPFSLFPPILFYFILRSDHASEKLTDLAPPSKDSHTMSHSVTDSLDDSLPPIGRESGHSEPGEAHLSDIRQVTITSMCQVSSDSTY